MKVTQLVTLLLEKLDKYGDMDVEVYTIAHVDYVPSHIAGAVVMTDKLQRPLNLILCDQTKLDSTESDEVVKT